MALLANVANLQEDPGLSTLGFERAKLHYMYDRDTIRQKLEESVSRVAQDRNIVFIEAGGTLSHGASVYLDAISVARDSKADLVLVLGGHEDAVVEEIAFLKRYVDLSGLRFKGVVVNRISDPEEFAGTYLPEIQRLDVPVLGVLPTVPELLHLSVSFLADSLFARVVAGEGGLSRQVKNVFVGAMASEAALRQPVFMKESKLCITSGDRSDMILAALETDTAAIILANNILPPPNILSMATQRNVPLLLVPLDTFQVAKQVDDLESLLTVNDTEKFERLEQLARTHLKLDELLS